MPEAGRAALELPGNVSFVPVALWIVAERATFSGGARRVPAGLEIGRNDLQVVTASGLRNVLCLRPRSAAVSKRSSVSGVGVDDSARTKTWWKGCGRTRHVGCGRNHVTLDVCE